MPAGPRIDFGAVKQPSGKVVTAFAVLADLEITDAPQQHVRTGMAERLGQDAGVPRGRPGRLVFGGASTHQAAQGTAPSFGPG